MWPALATAFSIAFFVLFLLARREARLRRDWLTPRGEKVYGTLERRLRFEMALAEITRAESFAELQLRSLEDAKHLLDAGYKVIANFAPTLLNLLAAMARFSRIVSAIPFASPVPRESTTAHWYRLRLYILRRSWALVIRYLRDSSQRVARPVPDDDLHALTEESVEVLRALLQKVVGQLSSDALWQLAERREQWRQAPETPAMVLWAALIVVALVASVLLRQL